MTRGLLRRLERLEAKARPTASDVLDCLDFSKLSLDELRRLLAVSEICDQHGESAVSAEQATDTLELLRKAAREGVHVAGF